MKSLISWPSPDLPWRDSGEGGLFSYAFWDTDDADSCCVEHNLRLMHYDVITFATGPLAEELSPDPNAEDAWWKRTTKIRQEWEKSHPDVPFYETALAERAAMYGFVPTAAVYLGSTSHSLWNTVDHRYFGVTRESLTAQGRSMVAAMEDAYGSPATFLTLLDT